MWVDESQALFTLGIKMHAGQLDQEDKRQIHT